jgi:hypothetical protein
MLEKAGGGLVCRMLEENQDEEKKQQCHTLQRGRGECARGVGHDEITDVLGKRVDGCFVWLIICSRSEKRRTMWDFQFQSKSHLN